MKKATYLAAFGCIALSSLAQAQNRLSNGSFEVFTVNSSSALTTAPPPPLSMLDYWSAAPNTRHVSSYDGYPHASEGRAFLQVLDPIRQDFNVMPHIDKGENLYVIDYSCYDSLTMPNFGVFTRFAPHCDQNMAVGYPFVSTQKKRWKTGAVCFPWSDGPNSCGMGEIVIMSSDRENRERLVNVDNGYLMNVRHSGVRRGAPSCWSAFNSVSYRGTLDSLFAKDDWRVELNSDCPGKTGMIYAVTMPLSAQPSVTASIDAMTTACTPKGSNIIMKLSLYNSAQQRWVDMGPVARPTLPVTGSMASLSRSKSFGASDPYSQYLIPSTTGKPCGLMLVMVTFSPFVVSPPPPKPKVTAGCFGVLVDRASLQ